MNWKYICFTAILLPAITNTAWAQFGAVHTIAQIGRLYGEDFLVMDMDLDDDNDIVQITPNKDLVLLRNDGTGHFAPPQLVAEGVLELPEFVDFNHDGLPDIVVRLANDLIGWMPNKGDGTFDNVVPISKAYFPIIIIDMNNDGEVDLFYGEYNPASEVTNYYWMENEGAGIFIDRHLFFQISDIEDIMFRDLRDMNNDGLPDFIFIRYFNFSEPHWYAQAPNGTLIGPEYIMSTTYQEFIDVDHDGFPDLVDYESSPYPYVLQWHKNDGLGNYGPPATLLRSLNGQVSQGDVDGDGVPDLIFIAEDRQIAWGRINGNGDFTFTSTSLTLNTDWKFADISGDGIGDFIFFYGAAINDGLGNFGPVISYNDEIGYFNHATPADADGDGDIDVFYRDGGKREIGWYQNDGQGGFAVKNEVETNFNGVTFVADFDADGFPDFVGGRIDTVQLLWRGGPGGNYGAPDTIYRDLNMVEIYEIADVDADGDVDCRIVYYLGSLGGWILNDGTGHFSEQFYPNDQFLSSVDIDGDGMLDLLKIRYTPDYELVWEKNLGNGNFAPGQIIGVYSFYGQTADMDHDGDQDLLITKAVTVNGVSYYLIWLENQNNGTAWVEHPIAQTYANLLCTSDFNGDGNLDVCIGSSVNMSPDTMNFFWYANDGAGNFGDPVFIEKLNKIFGLASVDFDEDGDSDVFFYGDFSAGWFENLGKDPLINGRCYFDANANGKQDSTEAPLAGIKISLEPGGQTTFSGPDGSFRFYGSPGDFLLTAEAGDCFETSSSPAAFSIHLPLSSSDTIFSFGFKNKTAQSSVTASVTASATRCGFSVPFWITLQNNGCYPSAAAVSLHFNNLVTFLSADSLPALAQGDSILWKSGDALQPGESRLIRALFRVAGAEHLGDSIKVVTNAWLSDSSGNLLFTPAATFFASEVNCAYDPNDKTVDRKVLPIEYDPANSELSYTIRFQNTGTDTAFNIRVLDTLSANLDWKSFRPRTTSHPCTIDLDETNGVLEYRFDNILLSDSTKNEPASHGFVSFSIQLKPDLPPSTGILNRAAIYFDFNAPVLTNTAETYIERLVSSSKEPVSAWPITILPNPNNGVFSVQLPEAAKAGMALRVLGLMGQLLLEQPVQAGVLVQTVQAGTLPAGMYFLQVLAGGKVMGVEKFVKQ